jgi:putative N6-adenine-specific DNA methylase
MRIVTTRKYMTDSSLDVYSITAPGLERVTAAELIALGVTIKSDSRGGVSWQGSLRDLYNANLWLRTASRVVIRVASFHAGSFAELERRAKRIPWGRFVRARDRVRFRVTCHKSALYHSDAVAQRLIEAASAATGCSPVSVTDAEDDDDGVGGEQLFVVRVDNDILSLSADSSGTLLHKRGYRQASAKAPMRETLAAAMLLSSGWNPSMPLLDPLCGSGTIPIEAALIGRRIAPGLHRQFRFERWPGFDPVAWGQLRERAMNGVGLSAPASIVASDRDAGALEAAASNAERAGVSADVELIHRPLSASQAAVGSRGWVITNPPYGVRVGTDVRNLYSKLGSMMRTELKGWRLGVLTASPELERQLAIPLERMFETKNGGIPISFVVAEGAI